MVKTSPLLVLNSTGVLHPYPFVNSVIEVTVKLMSDPAKPLSLTHTNSHAHSHTHSHTHSHIPLTIIMCDAKDTNIIYTEGIDIINPVALVLDPVTSSTPVIRIKLTACSTMASRQVVLVAMMSQDCITPATGTTTGTATTVTAIGTLSTTATASGTASATSIGTGTATVVTSPPPVATSVSASVAASRAVSIPSKPFQVVKYRMIITNENQIVSTFFKDEGGKKNQIPIHVQLVTPPNTPFDRNGMKLKCLLLYNDGLQVSDQTLLNISDDRCLYVDANGYAKINCRIEDISLNHEKQKFVVKVSPDLDSIPLSADVNDQRTPGITVRTKISKSNRVKRNLPMSGCCSVSSGSSTSSGNDSDVTDNDNDSSGYSGSKRIRTTPPITPANLTKQMQAAANDKVLDFANCTMHTLLKLREDLSQQPAHSSAEHVRMIIDQIASHHQTLGLGLPFPDAPLHLNPPHDGSVISNNDDTFEEACDNLVEGPLPPPRDGSADSDEDMSMEVIGNLILNIFQTDDIEENHPDDSAHRNQANNLFPCYEREPRQEPPSSG